MKKIYFEFFRGISSVFILGWHLVFLAPTGHPTHFTGYWGTDALMMFFMLSGLVIDLTQTNKPKRARAFLTNRFIRIYPQFVVGMMLAFIALMVTHTALPSSREIFGNFLMLSTMKDYMGYVVPSIQSNLAIWSLSFEMAFYVLFALTIGRYQKKALAYWFVLSLIAIPLYFLKNDRDIITHIIAVFAFSSIWLIGYYIYEYRHYFYAGKYAALFGLGILPLVSRLHFCSNFYDPCKYFILSLFAIPFFRYCLQIPPAGKQIKVKYLVGLHILFVAITFITHYMPLANAIAYSALPYVYMGIAWLIGAFKLNEKAKHVVDKLGTVLGKYSYSLYISHFPILFMLASFIHSVPVFVLVALPIVAVVAYVLEHWLQPIVVRFFKRPKRQRTEFSFPLKRLEFH